MKKFISILLTIVCSICCFISLTACSSDNSTVTSTQNTTTDNGTNKDNDTTNNDSIPSFSKDETVIYKNVHYTVTNITYSNGEDYDTPDDGNKFIIVELKIENKSEKTISYNTWDWKIINSQGQIDGEAFTTIDSDTNLNSGDLAKNGSKTGTMVFEVPQNETSIKLYYYGNILSDDPSFEIILL